MQCRDVHPKCLPYDDTLADSLPDYNIEFVQLSPGYYYIRGVYHLWAYPGEPWRHIGCDVRKQDVNWRKYVSALAAAFPNATIAVGRWCAPAVPHLHGTETLYMFSNIEEETAIERFLGPIIPPGSVTGGVLYAKSSIKVTVPMRTSVGSNIPAAPGCPFSSYDFELRAEYEKINLGMNIPFGRTTLKQAIAWLRSQGLCAARVTRFITEIAYSPKNPPNFYPYQPSLDQKPSPDQRVEQKTDWRVLAVLGGAALAVLVLVSD